MNRDFPSMFVRPVDIEQQRNQILFENDVIVRTPQTATLAKLRKSDAAHRALLFVDRRNFLNRLLQLQLLGKQVRQSLRRRDRIAGFEKLPRVILAQMHHLRTLWVRQLSDMKGGYFLAVLTLHRKNSFSNSRFALRVLV